MANNHNLILEYNFKEPVSNIYDVILDFRKFGYFHPHMKEINIVSRINPNEVEYHVNEELLLYGCILLKPRYNATVIEIEKDKHIKYISQVKKNILLTIDFMFSENEKNGTTKLIEKMDVKSNRFIASVFFGILKRSHLKVFQNFNSSQIN